MYLNIYIVHQNEQYYAHNCQPSLQPTMVNSSIEAQFQMWILTLNALTAWA